MNYSYRPHNVCPSMINVVVENGVLKDAEFLGGCDGNHKAVVALAKGLTFEEIKEKLSGIRCGLRPTSCGDQLVKAIEEAMKNDKLSD